VIMKEPIKTKMNIGLYHLLLKMYISVTLHGFEHHLAVLLLNPPKIWKHVFCVSV